MRQRELAKLISKLGDLTRGQRQKLVAELSAGEQKMASVEVIEAATISCPHCQCGAIVRNGRASGLQRFKCRGCSRTFNALTGSPLARLRMKGKWLGQMSSMQQGMSINATAEKLGVNSKTAFLWRHRFMALPKTVQAQALAGIAEADQTYFLHSNKGQREGITRAARKRGGKAKKRGLSSEQVPVLVVRDRAGQTADFILEADNSAHVVAALKPILPKDTILCTDGSNTLYSAAKTLEIEHHAINVSAGVRVDGAWHIQNINAYHGRLKAWMARFKGVATKYLDSYLGWFRAIDRDSSGHPNSALWLAAAIRS